VRVKYDFCNLHHFLTSVTTTSISSQRLRLEHPLPNYSISSYSQSFIHIASILIGRSLPTVRTSKAVFEFWSLRLYLPIVDMLDAVNRERS